MIVEVDKNGDCLKCGEPASEYGQGLNHKCRENFILREKLIRPKELINAYSNISDSFNGIFKCKEKSIGEKAEEIAECVATSENVENDLNRILDSIPTDPIMKSFNQAFKDGVKNASEPIDNGGPAFPVTFQHNNGTITSYQEWKGMSLRDWFAGMALSGLLNYHEHDFEGGCRQSEKIVKCAYIHADAMLRAR